MSLGELILQMAVIRSVHGQLRIVARARGDICARICLLGVLLRPSAVQPSLNRKRLLLSLSAESLVCALVGRLLLVGEHLR